MGKETKPGWVFTQGEKGAFRPFWQFRQIAKGRNRGKLEILLPPTKGRKILVDPGAIRSYPSQNIDLSLFEKKESTDEQS